MRDVDSGKMLGSSKQMLIQEPEVLTPVQHRPSASLGTSSWPGGGIGRHNRLKSGTTDGFESLPGHQAEVAQR